MGYILLKTGPSYFQERLCLMNCEAFEANISGFLDNSLSDLELQEFWEHGIECDDCVYEAMARTFSQLRPNLANPELLAASLEFDDAARQSTQATPDAGWLTLAKNVRAVFIRSLVNHWRQPPLKRIDTIQSHLSHTLQRFDTQ